jgi:plasmid stability protein
MTSLTVKLPETLRQKLESFALMSGRSVSSVVRETLSAKLSSSASSSSLFGRTQDLCGGGESSIKDLATNSKHMDGYGT